MQITRRVAHWGVAAALLLSAGVQAAGPTPLVDAVKRGQLEAVRQLLRQQADANEREADGTSALHWAVRSGNHDAVALLLKAGADVKAANRYGVTPLSLAATNGDAVVLEQLLAAGASPTTANAEGETVLHTAARTGCEACIKALVAKGAPVNAGEGWFGETPVMWAAAENHAGAVRLLAELGADLNARSKVIRAPELEFPRSGGPNSPFPRGGWTPLMFAARQGATEAARALADLGANLDAVALPQTDVLLKEADYQLIDKGIGTSALVFAIINSHYELAAMLLEKGADPNVHDMAGEAALYATVHLSSLQWVQGRPAPILTDAIDAVDLATLLIKHGANPNARLTSRPLKRHHDAGSTLNFGEGTTPLMRAARTNDVAMMRALLDGGADPLLTLPDYTTSLMIAAGLGAGGLRGEGVRIVVPTEDGATEAVSMLLDRGVDVNAYNSAGNTALHGAVTRGDAVVKLLASRGAVLTIRNKAGFTPLDLAQGAGGRGGRGGVVRESTTALLRKLMQDAGITPPPPATPAASAAPVPVAP